jgi:hypothetical protein
MKMMVMKRIILCKRKRRKRESYYIFLPFNAISHFCIAWHWLNTSYFVTHFQEIGKKHCSWWRWSWVNPWEQELKSRKNGQLLIFVLPFFIITSTLVISKHQRDCFLLLIMFLHSISVEWWETQEAQKDWRRYWADGALFWWWRWSVLACGFIIMLFMIIQMSYDGRLLDKCDMIIMKLFGTIICLQFSSPIVCKLI